jgi:hypothetical protein
VYVVCVSEGVECVVAQGVDAECAIREDSKRRVCVVEV